MGTVIDDLVKRFSRLEKDLDAIVLPKAELFMRQALEYAITDFYMSYMPQDYDRTGNFFGLTNSPKFERSEHAIEMTVSSSGMSGYPGWNGEQGISADDAFDLLYMNGCHGGGKWIKAVSVPPDLILENKIKDYQNNVLPGVVRNAASRLLGIKL